MISDQGFQGEGEFYCGFRQDITGLGLKFIICDYIYDELLQSYI